MAARSTDVGRIEAEFDRMRSLGLDELRVRRPARLGRFLVARERSVPCVNARA
jgi:hypothetical protein